MKTRTNDSKQWSPIANTKIVHKSTNSIRKKLVHTKPNHCTDSNKIGTYVIPCNDCEKSYVGETGRNLNVRLNEHRRDIRMGSVNSAPFCHVRDFANFGHSLNWERANIVYFSQTKKHRCIVESTLIKHVPNFNTNPGSLTVDSSLKDIILRSLPQMSIKFPP